MLTRILSVTVLMLVSTLLLAACTSASSTSDPSVLLEARWEIDEDANLAVPVCPSCGDVADHADGICSCGQHYVIPDHAIDCPDCAGAATCAHCHAPDAGTAKHDCVACDNTGHCPICDGSGQHDGETCPECDGGKGCGACAQAAKAKPGCKHCDDSGSCSNCGGTGKLQLHGKR